MLFGVRETSDGFRAARHLSLDAHEQDPAIRILDEQGAIVLQLPEF